MNLKDNKKEIMRVIDVKDENLKKFISRYWIFKKNGVDKKIPKLFPLPNAHILIHLRDDCEFKSENEKIIGKSNQVLYPTTNVYEVLYGLDTHIVGIELSVQGYYYLTNSSFVDKINTIEELDDIDEDLNSFINNIKHQLSENNFSKLEVYLKKRLEKYYKDKTANMIYEIAKSDDEEKKLSEIAKDYNISTRTLERIFKRNTGLTFKKYQLIIRLNNLLEAIYKNEDVNWSELSVDYGFFDQAHMINAMKKYLGETPNKYLTLRNLLGDIFDIEK